MEICSFELEHLKNIEKLSVHYFPDETKNMFCKILEAFFWDLVKHCAALADVLQDIAKIMNHVKIFPKTNSLKKWSCKKNAQCMQAIMQNKQGTH